MRWVIAIGLIAGCGRIGFDPSAAAGGPGGPPDVESDAAAPPGAPASAHYITGGTTSFPAPTTMLLTTTSPLTDRDMVLVVAVHWRDTTSSVTTVLDSFGNGFSTATGMTRYNAAQSQIIWFKRVTMGTAIQVVFDQPAAGADIKWAAYRDIDQVATVMAGSASVGTSAIADTGALTVDGPAVLVASSASRAADAAAGPGYTQRHEAGGGVLEDRDVGGAGEVNATATLSTADDWIIQIVALRPRN